MVETGGRPSRLTASSAKDPTASRPPSIMTDSSDTGTHGATVKGSRLCGASLKKRCTASGTRPLPKQKSPRRGFPNWCLRPGPASMRVGPDLLLGEIQQPRQQDQEHEHLQ